MFGLQFAVRGRVELSNMYRVWRGRWFAGSFLRLLSFRPNQHRSALFGPGSLACDDLVWPAGLHRFWWSLCCSDLVVVGQREQWLADLATVHKESGAHP